MTTEYCITHDTHYEAAKKEIHGRAITTPCPLCAAEMLNTPRPEALKENQEIQSENHKTKSAGVFRNSGIPPRYTTRTVDNFVADTDKKQKALASVKNYVEKIDKVCEYGTSMIMTGGVGTGKTHLASAIGNSFIGKGKAVAFMTVSTMFRRIRETYNQNSSKTEQEVINDLRKVDLLILDEIGVQKGSESEEHLLFEVLNERYCYYKPTILMSNLTAEEISGYVGARVIDRLKEGGGRLVIFDWESYRSKAFSDEALPNRSGAKYDFN